jgi:hypothetical protein
MEISYTPYEKIIIRSYMEFDTPRSLSESIASEIIKGIPQPRLFWANGILFRYFPFYASEAISAELIKGVLNIDQIEFSLMNDFKNEIQVSSTLKLKVLNVTNHALFNPLAKYIKDNIAKKKEKD